MPVFTVDLEDWYHAVLPKEKWPKERGEIYKNCFFIFDLLEKYQIKAIVYVLGHLADKEPGLIEWIESKGHAMGSHGYWHGHNEKSDSELFRSPYWDTTPLPGLCGGFFFRLLPLPALIKEIKRTKMFYIHPHDIYEEHPFVGDPLDLRKYWINWKRHVGLKTARKKLDQLLQEIEFDAP